MSSTNRGAKRNPADFYPTPGATTRAFIQWLTRPIYPGSLNPVDGPRLLGDVLDPCAGDGAILKAAGACTACGVGALSAFEIRATCKPALEAITDDVWIVDALREEVATQAGAADTIICNPPFSLAREFVERYRHTTPVAAFLLRLGFLASQKRAPWWVANPPAHVLVLPERPSFTGDGKTDSADYAWVVWMGRTERGETRLDWLVWP